MWGCAATERRRRETLAAVPTPIAIVNTAANGRADAINRPSTARAAAISRSTPSVTGSARRRSASKPARFTRSVNIRCPLKTPPTGVLLAKAAGVDKGSGVASRTIVGQISERQLQEIAQQKMRDLNANDIEAAKRMVEGTARSMGIKIVR